MRCPARWFREWFQWVLLLGVMLGAATARAEAGIEIAIAPFLPVSTMAQNYEPMRLFLEKRFNEPVLFVTAPNYKTFHERMLRYEYNYLITVANAAYLAQAEAGYVPLFRPAINTRPVLVVKRGNPLESLDELHGSVIAMPDPLAIISMQGLRMLRENGLEDGAGVTVKHVKNHGTAVNYVLSGEATAAVISDRALEQMATSTKGAVRVVQSWDKGAAPGVVYLASPRLSKARVRAYAGALQDFVASQDGLALMQKLGYGTLVPAGTEDLKFLAPYGQALKEGMAHAATP